MLFPLYDTNPHHRTPWFTLLIIAANVAVMFWLAGKNPQDQQRIVVEHGFVPKRIAQLGDPKLVVVVNLQAAPEHVPERGKQPGPARVIKLEPREGQIYASMFTMMFLHGGWMHLIGNMWFLWIFGNNVEDRLGHLIFVLFYVMGGLIALGCHWVTDPGSTIPTIGASGAVAAVLGAYAITFPTAKVRTLVFFGLIALFDLPALVVLGGWFVLQLLAAVNAAFVAGFDGGVAWWAHVGGFAAGLILMPIMSMGAAPSGQDWDSEANRHFGPPPE